MSGLARIIATWFGCGYAPKGPGTVGSVAALAIAWLLNTYAGISSIGLGWLALLLAIPGVLLGMVGFKLHPLGFLIAVPYFLLLSAVMSAVRGIFTVALYRYATAGEAPAGFASSSFKEAFVDKSGRY